MTELSAVNVKITGDASGLKAAASAATKDVEKVGVAADKTSKQTARMGKSAGALGAASIGSSHKIRMLSMQLSQVGQQAMAGGGIIRALAIQLPDIGLAFGTVGTAAGLLAGIALPAVMSAFGATGVSAADLETALEGVTEALSNTSDIADIAAGNFDKIAERYGDLTSSALELIAAQKQIGLRELADSAGDLNDALTALYDGNAWLNVSRAEDLANGLRLSQDASREFASSLSALSQAGDLQTQVDLVGKMRQRFLEAVGPVETMSAEQLEFFTHLVDSEEAMLQLIKRAKELEPEIGDAADEAGRLSTNLIDALNAKNKLSQGVGSSGVGRGRGGVVPNASDILMMRMGGEFIPSATKPRRGGGGAKSDPLARELEQVQNAVMSQTELLNQTYIDQQETLRAALEQRLITQEEYQNLMQQAAQRHADAMRGVDDGYHGDTVAKAGKFFGELAGAMRSGSDKMYKIAQGAAIAEALLSAKSSAISAWEKGMKIGGPATAAAFTTLSLAKTAGMIAGLSSSSSAAGGGGAAGASVPSAPATSREVAISLTGGDMFGRDQVIGMVNAINEAVEDGVNLRLV